MRRTLQQMTHALVTLLALVSAALAQTPVGPGTPYPGGSEISDQKAGSVLIYNLYSSSATNPAAQNTRINITNINVNTSVTVHLFFVDGATCSPADSFICLTQNQTASFLASDIDPGITGYIVAVAVDGTTGCPINFNFLIGDEFVKLSSGHAANLSAEALSAIAATPVVCDPSAATAQLNFNHTAYNRLPRVVAVSSLPSRVDGNDTLLIVNRIAGNLATGAAPLGAVFGLLYDDAERPASFSFSASSCQFRASLTNTFPRTTPRFETFIPAGRSGWLKLYALSDVALLGAVIIKNDAAGTNAGAFSGGRNFHKLTFSDTASFEIPVFPPGC